MTRWNTNRKIFRLILPIVAAVSLAGMLFLTAEAAEEHNLVEVPEKEATCTEEGNIAYWYCLDCGKYFSDPDGEDEISPADTVIPVTSHEWAWSETEFSGTDYKEIDIRFECMHCYATREETVLIETVGMGVEAHSTLTWSDLVTAKELGDLFENDAEIDLDLDLRKYGEDEVPASDSKLIENMMAKLRPGYDYAAVYLDISANMYITHADGREETRNYAKTLNPVEITVTIPDEIANAGEDACQVIRIHADEAEVLDSTEKDGRLTFTSDKFSTYALVKATDTAAESEPGPVKTGDKTDGPDEKDTPDTDGNTNEPDEVKTADNSHFMLWFVIMLLGAAGVIAAVSLKRRAYHVKK